MNISSIMDEFPRVHDFTEKTGRREGWTISICMPWRNLQVHSERKFHPSIRSFEQNFFFLGGLVSSSSARYSNFVYDNTIREIIIFVTIVTEKKKKKKIHGEIPLLSHYRIILRG